MRISDWSSDVCSSDLGAACNDADAPDLRQIERERGQGDLLLQRAEIGAKRLRDDHRLLENLLLHEVAVIALVDQRAGDARHGDRPVHRLVVAVIRSEEHTSELQSLMRISYAVFCLKKK